MTDLIKVAAVQTDPRIAETAANLEGILTSVQAAAASQARLIVFPECSLTGYIFRSREEAMSAAETLPGPASGEIAALCAKLGVYVVFGLLERDESCLFNAAALVGPAGIIGAYRKTHLPFQGVDRFATPGDRPFRVYPTPVGNIGLFICYDIVFPETARVMALLGADILALPTNFPEARREVLATHLVVTRAIENRVHVIAADRVGRERDYGFAGLSKIVSATGKNVALASRDQTEIIYGELDLDQARRKRLVITPGEYELDYIGDRRPELYRRITEDGPDAG